MALNINRSRLNDSIQRMLSFYMQNKLGELSNERYFDRSMGVMSEQDRLMRERAAEEDVRARKLKEYGSKVELQDYIQKGFFDTALKNDAFTAKIRAAQGAEAIGDVAKAKADRASAFEMAVPAIMGNFDAFKGKVSPESLAAGLEAFGESGMEQMMDKAVQQDISKRGAATAQRGQDITIRGQNIDISKQTAEQGGPGVMGDKQRKEYIDYITDTEKYLIDQGVKGEAIGQSVRDFMGSFKYLDPMSKENRGKTLTYLGEIRLQLIQGKPPTPPQLSFLTKVRDVSAIEGGGMAPAPTGTTGVQKPLKPMGLPSPTTGLYGSETVDAEAKINDNMLAMITNQIMQRLGLGEDKRDYATGLAREFLAGIK